MQDVVVAFPSVFDPILIKVKEGNTSFDLVVASLIAGWPLTDIEVL